MRQLTNDNYPPITPNPRNPKSPKKAISANRVLANLNDMGKIKN